MIKNYVGYISYCCLIYFIGYIVSALFTQKTMNFLLILLLINLIQGFLGEKK